MSKWTIRLCEIPFEADHILAKCYAYVQRQLPSHSFWQLCDDDKIIEEIHGTAYCLNDEIDWSLDPKILILDMARPKRNSLFRLVANAYQFKTNDEKKVIISIAIEGTESAIIQRWNAALQYAHDVNTYLPRYHLLKSNCNTLSGVLGDVLNAGVKSTRQAVGFGQKLTDGPDRQLSRYFNEQIGLSTDILHQQRQSLSDVINTIGGKVVYLGSVLSNGPELTVGEERPLKARKSDSIQLL